MTPSYSSIAAMTTTLLLTLQSQLLVVIIHSWDTLSSRETRPGCANVDHHQPLVERARISPGENPPYRRPYRSPHPSSAPNRDHSPRTSNPEPRPLADATRCQPQPAASSSAHPLLQLPPATPALATRPRKPSPQSTHAKSSPEARPGGAPPAPPPPLPDRARPYHRPVKGTTPRSPALRRGQG